MLPHTPLVIENGFCTFCNLPVKLVQRHDGEHYEHYDITNVELPEQDEKTAKRLRELRKGKKTVAFVGMNPRTCSLAPFKEKGVEIWGVNEEHAFYWMTRADRWIQIHPKESWTQEVAKRGIRGHAEWLMANEWNIPIYMKQKYKEVPNSIQYPLQEVCKVFDNFRVGNEKVKYFTSSFAYCMGLALLEQFERIEIYGYNMTGAEEYVDQKACSEFWMGLALGMGIEIYTPPDCKLLNAEMYGE